MVKKEENFGNNDFFKINSNEEILKDFNWDDYKNGLDGIKIDQKEKEEMINLYKENMPFSDSKDKIIEGTIIKKNEREVIVDINGKSEGVISLNELRNIPDIKIGDKIDVIISSQDDKKGQLVLSHRKARTIKAWNKVNEAQETGEILTGFVKARTRGGMIVDVLGIETFLPGSQIDVKQITNYDEYIGKTMDLKVVKINPEFNNVVVSHKAIIEDDIQTQKKDIIGKLEKGQVLEGIVKNLTNYGVFIDLGGIDGLVHVTDISWNRISQPSDILEIGQVVKVVILDFAEEKNRVQLGIKQLHPHPWDQLDPNIKNGDKIKGKILLLTDYGAFLEIIPGVEGLIHVSEMSWSTHLRSAQDFVSVGDEVEVIVLNIDRAERKISLGMKQLIKDPWTDITERFPVGSKHLGKVLNFTNFGTFLELADGVEGLVHITDLSWTQKIKHPSEFCKIGDKLEVVVLELDVENRRLSLGHKQLNKNPWETYENKYKIGLNFEGIVKDVFEKGSNIILKEDNIETFCPRRFMVKQDGKILSKGEILQFKILEFSKDLKKVVVSHTSVFRDEEEKIVKDNNKKVNDSNSSSTKLGDMGILSSLKDKMEGK